MLPPQRTNGSRPPRADPWWHPDRGIVGAFGAADRPDIGSSLLPGNTVTRRENEDERSVTHEMFDGRLATRRRRGRVRPNRRHLRVIREEGVDGYLQVKHWIAPPDSTSGARVGRRLVPRRTGPSL
jgi:hypothetical protein